MATVVMTTVIHSTASGVTNEEWLQDGLEMTSIQITRMAEKAYLLATVDDMGNSDFWLEVYHFPSDAWLKELEVEPSQNQDPDSSADVEVKWSPLAAVIKIQPPKTPAGTELDGPLENDFLTHCLALDKDMGSSQWDEQPFDKEAGKINESLRPKDSGDIPTVIAPVPFLQREQESSCSAGRQSQLFSFTFGEHGIMEQYIISHPDSQRQNTLEEAYNIYLRQRVLSVDERNKAIAHTWKQLQDTSELEQQRHSRAAAS
ncbi:hypothetical protein KUCAC02_002155 [Chaenocephalus aceratus]|uniref:Uncharacterized protein n=1 Tax=Chaenocephalus aceratus TaxID=36190 RepID=A0ACB9XSS1_CHAAC|nr:hypothetical protein KUCAC02_002155 [Chaenocephalus aceratus]